MLRSSRFYWPLGVAKRYFHCTVQAKAAGEGLCIVRTMRGEGCRYWPLCPSGLRKGPLVMIERATQSDSGPS
jgi:hypothetical protein